MSQKLRLGMVGGGRGSMMGTLHRLAAAKDDNFEIVAGALSSDAERAAASAKLAGIAPDRSYTSYEEMARSEAARDDGIDAVAILTPNHLHAPVAMAFIKQGIHVICEKPMTATREEAEALTRLADEQAAIFVLTHSYTGFPMVRRAREIARSGVLGDLRSLRSIYFQGWMAERDADGTKPENLWRSDPAKSGIAGTLADVGSHALHLLTWVTGAKLRSVAAELSAFGTFSALDNDASLLLRFEEGIKGALWCSQVAIGQSNGLSMAIHGSKGALTWNVQTPGELTLARVGQTPEVLMPDDSQKPALEWWTERGFVGFEHNCAAFAELYANAGEMIRARMENRQPSPATALAPTVHEGLEVMRFIDAAVRSSHANAAWVNLP